MGTPTIYFHPEAYSTKNPKLMGRNAAGESFLRAFLQHTRYKNHWIYSDNQQANIFRDIANSFGRNEEISIVNRSTINKLSQSGTLFYPGPDIFNQAYNRGSDNSSKWSICGITHTTSSEQAMFSISSLITSPVESWDALICTSNAVKSNVEHLLSRQVDYLKNRLGITKLHLPQLPVIPLGIHVDDFSFSDKQKNKARKDLGLSVNDVVFLYLGRLSFHAKSNPFPLYKALKIANEKTNKNLVLIECGWFANDFIKNAYINAFNLICPEVKRIVLDGIDNVSRENAWAASDVFCSLSDNIQETFGITPLEAKASSLPVVASDWNGYKDTIRNSIDGFLIPSLMPKPGLGADLALRHSTGVDTYDMYCGHTSSLIALDIKSIADSFIQLINSSTLRTDMGLAGKQHVRDNFDWSKIITRYQELWGELSSIRNSTKAVYSTNVKVHPVEIDPFESFNSYPTGRLEFHSNLQICSNHTIDDYRKYIQLDLINYAKYVFPQTEDVEKILLILKDKSLPVSSIINEFTENKKPFIMRGLNILIKLGILFLVK